MKAIVMAPCAALALAACDGPRGDAPPPPPTSRSDAVGVKSAAPIATTTAKPSTSSPPPPAPKRDLCAGQSLRAGPKAKGIKAKAAAGATAPATPMPLGVGKWVWVNLWAAWCGPCKEEMPRVLAMTKKLADAGASVDVAFVSLDDDERQLERFLESSPKESVHASYWLPEGETRSGFLHEIGAKETIDLPVQLFVAPSGQLACLAQGAVEDRDYAAIAAMVGARK